MAAPFLTSDLLTGEVRHVTIVADDRKRLSGRGALRDGGRRESNKARNGDQSREANETEHGGLGCGVSRVGDARRGRSRATVSYG